MPHMEWATMKGSIWVAMRWRDGEVGHRDLEEVGVYGLLVHVDPLLLWGRGASHHPLAAA